MKNNASNSSNTKACAKQALQMQAQQMLPTLTMLFSSLNYSEISHQRISQQSNNNNNNNENDYQGLTRAQHLQFGRVMIKWQLTAASNQNLAGLTHEIGVLKSINNLSANQKRFQDSLFAIAPPMLAYETLRVKVLDQFSQLTILTMPYYPSGSLATQLNIRNYSSLTTQKKHHFMVQSAHLIATLHSAGWLHNDIKPSNILLDNFLPNHADNSCIKADLLLTDFALAECLNTPILASPAGTPAYLAPERWQSQSATVQSDIYAFGIMMVEILTGKRPFQISANSNDKLKAWAIQHCQQPIPTLPLEYSHYQGIINKALAKRVERRYQNMKQILLDLESIDRSWL
ncbi:serine/threonine protein kinase [Psychrobacter sp. JCM 18902]|uniref:serine/threonine protein kinase n=1 Tax=Psychrobacter sp. JCM 18902 TaxID=1298607 RepID=UPI000433598E|nr:protein kinase [Psychrobacter sp. JCM 18902]GAF58363.1 serine/threonine protein kinase [Psychrobacter sp. JCM 18902]